ncbi:hypothetical protein [Bradyrhizobium sp. BR13661]|jgi:hypothetical protein|uniref:hypothetical protein n=1 Tax=Bradyrhizobium sp. BR13661 TaxID=2940622 RepID=UPI002475AE75|nr:hypothetical protein [Bradyrhizobium sp. BR13661]
MDGSLSTSSLRILISSRDVCDARQLPSLRKLLAAVIDCDVTDFRQGHDLPAIPAKTKVHSKDALACFVITPSPRD